MPQTTVLPVYTAEYPILAKAQKPGGVTVLSAVGAGDVPNKPTMFTATIQVASLAVAEEAEASVAEEEVVDESVEETVEEVGEEAEEEEKDDNGDPKPRRAKPHHRGKSRR
jgi:hypothetical protein